MATENATCSAGGGPADAGGGLRRLPARVWLSGPMIRLGCVPLDILGGLLIGLGRLDAWVRRERASLAAETIARQAVRHG